MAQYRYGHSQLIFEEKWQNYASGRKSKSNSDLFWLHRLTNLFWMFTYEGGGSSLLPKSVHHFRTESTILLFKLMSQYFVQRNDKISYFLNQT